MTKKLQNNICPLILGVVVLTAQFVPAFAKHSSKVQAKSSGQKSQAKSQGKSQEASAEESVKVYFKPYLNWPHPVRIGIASRSPTIRVAVWAPGAVFVEGKPVFALNPRELYSIAGGRITEYSTGKSYALPRDKRSLISASNYIILANNRWYRGVLEIINYGYVATAINVLDLEDYLQGVVPSEMPANWHLEALKAQAVAARSYAWAHLGSGSKWMRREGYDIVPDVRDQAYKGLAVESPKSSQAVAQTYGVVLKDAGRVKAGFYRAWVGDEMENLNIRKTAVAESVLEKMTGVPKIVGVVVKHWDSVGNATHLQILGQKKNREVDGVVLAHWLGFSTPGILDVQEQGSNWVFTYRGPGNGARGLSQHGAESLAQNGWRWDLILQQYYQDPDGHLHLSSINTYRPRFAAVPKPAPEEVPTVDSETVKAELRDEKKAEEKEKEEDKPKEDSNSSDDTNTDQTN